MIQQAVTKRQALEAPAWFGSRTFHGCPAIEKTMGISKRRMILENFWKVTFPPRKKLGRSRLPFTVTFCCPWWQRKNAQKVQVLQSAQEGLSVKAVLELQRMEQAASMDTLDLSRGRSNGYQRTGNLQVSKIHVLIGLEVNS